MTFAAAMLMVWAVVDDSRTGEFTDDHKDPQGNVLIRFKMRVPETLPDQPRLGLIVHFHGITQGENHIHKNMTRGLDRVGLLDNYIVAGGKSKGSGWGGEDDKGLLSLIEWICSTYPVDRRRVHLVGYSNGAYMVSRFGWQHMAYFASGTVYAGASLGGGGKGNPADTKMEWYLVHGDADDICPVEDSRSASRQLERSGYRHIYREVAGKKHGILGVKEVNDDMFRWLDATRNKELPPSRGEMKLLQQARSDVRRKPLGEISAALAEAVRIGGAFGGQVVASALEPKEDDVRMEAVKAFQKTMFDSRTVAALGKLLTREKSAEVKAELFKSFAILANWRYTGAHQVLIALLRSKSAALEERTAAIGCLAQGVALCRVGNNFHDKVVFQVLVMLLEDKEEAVRAAAFEALRGFSEDAMGFDPAGSEADRKAAAKHWQKWFMKCCGGK